MNLKEVNRQFASGKTAHDPSVISKDDEDKGSSLQDEVNRLLGSRPFVHADQVCSKSSSHQRDGKIDSSAEALRVDHHPLSFPPKFNLATTPRE